MVLAEVGSGIAERVISPLVVTGEQELQPCSDLVAASRRLWDQTFAEVAELPSEAFQMLPTGIGRAPGDNKHTAIRHFADGSHVPFYTDLRTHFGHVPQVLFLTGSPLTAEDIVGFTGLCDKYKKQGVRFVVPTLSVHPHERQDHDFVTADGSPMHQATTLRDAIRGFAGWHPVYDEEGNLHFQPSADALLVVQPHSAYAVEYGLEEGIPVLPLDALELLYNAANLKDIRNPFVLGPDKGRKVQADILAGFLGGCPKAYASKVRDRKSVKGTPTVKIPDDALAFIKQNNCTGVIADDELREGGTVGALAVELNDYAGPGVVVVVPKFICAGEAVSLLGHSAIRRIVTTDAISPITDISPIKHKLEVVSLQPEIERLVDYFRHGHMVDGRNENWLQPGDTGTRLRLDHTLGAD